MDIQLLTDMIKDDRGNYYVAVYKNGKELTLVNAAVERAFYEVLEFNEDFKTKHAEYERQFIGKIAMDKLRHDVVYASREDGHGRMYDLDAVAAHTGLRLSIRSNFTGIPEPDAARIENTVCQTNSWPRSARPAICRCMPD